MRWPWTVVLLLVGCAPDARVIPLLRTAGEPVTVTPPRSTPLAVSTRATSVPDPLPVQGALVKYADVEPALATAVGTGVADWAEAHRGARPAGWSLLIELTQGDLQYRDGRLLVNLGVRATLRARADNAYLAQTSAYCQEAGVVPPDRGAPILYACMADLGRELSGWLGGVEP